MTTAHSVLDELRSLDKQHFIHSGTSLKSQQDGPSFIFTKGRGIYLEDISGKKFIDGRSSFGVVTVGYGRQEIIQAAMEQMSKLSFSVSFGSYSNEPAIRLAAKIAEITPGDLNAIIYTTGGSESNDTAFKLVRHYWKLKGQNQRKKIVGLRKGYHGVTMGATSATGFSQYWDFTNSLAPDFYHADTYSLSSLRNVIESEGPETIAAFIAEPVQGTGGVNLPPDGYFKSVREMCDEYGILMIMDEVVTGFGRTGNMFGSERMGIVPDMMVVAKGITSGYIPLGGVILSKQLHAELIDLSTEPFFHGFTYNGHALACAVALKNIEIIEQENLPENAQKMEQEMLAGFRSLQNECEFVGEVRVKGLMGAFDIVKNKETNEKFSSPIAPKILEEAIKRGLLCRTFTLDGADLLTFNPPLIITKEEVKKIFEILHDSLFAVKKTL